ncbi:phage Gp37/Gp68 family protein [Polaromonas sp.]|uniref:phage Gp37/Gp68 family protein n=1 Tax=Polaromonas sp. TaxID=1869339 RepID=UPI0032643DF6
MSENTKIEWADHTLNGWIGCTKVSVGPQGACVGCYAEVSTPARVLRARGLETWGPGAPRSRTKTWGDPVKWNANHEAFFAQHGRRQRVFCSSLSDVFDNEVPEQWRADLFDLIAQTPNLDWLLLTKRIGNADGMINGAITRLRLGGWKQLPWPWPNVWLGATVVTQAEADRDIPKLLATPAAKRFLSMEPLLGPVRLHRLHIGCDTDLHHQWGINPEHDHIDALHPALRARVDWVIAGGESGQGARPSHPDWFRSLRDQCAAAGVPFLFKQWGEHWPFVNEDHYTHAREEKHAHAWVDAETGGSGLCWIVDDDGIWSNHTGAPRMSPKGEQRDDGGSIHPAIAVLGRVGKKAAGRLLDGVTHDGYPS